MITILLVIIGVLMLILLLIIACYKLLKRNSQVYDFRHKINIHCYKWSTDNLVLIASGEETNAYEWFYPKMPSYQRMLYSTKPLEYKYWFDEKDINKLLSL